MWLLGTTACLLLVVAAVNYLVNPYSYYSPRLLPSLGWHSRRTKVEMLEARGRAPQALIFGSSRTMKVAPRNVQRLSGLDTFNACVDSARVEDWTAMYRYATEVLGAPVEEIVIGADVEAFHDSKEVDPRLLATYQLRPYVPLAKKWVWYFSATAEAFSGIQFAESLKSLEYHFRGYPPGKYRFDDEGVLHYVEWEKQIAAGTFKWDPSLDEYDGRLEGMTGLAPWRCRSFEELLQLTERRGTRIRLFITPLHPVLLAHLRQTRNYDSLRAATLAYLQARARENRNLKVVDFTEVSAFGGEPDGFLDGAHTTDENSRIMTEALWSQTAFAAN